MDLFVELYQKLRNKPKHEDYVRFMSNVEAPSSDKCWLWTGSTDGGRYGQSGYRVAKGQWRSVRVHKLMAEWVYGEFPKWWRVKRSCGVDLCVNPSHIYIGPASSAQGSKQELFEELWVILKNPPERERFDRFIEKVEAKNWHDCWLWRARIDRDGYGQFAIRGSESGSHIKKAHAVIGTWYYGKLPKGFDTDHIRCNNRACVNPTHLIQTTHRENTMRDGSENICAKHSRKTHCKYGHALTADNLCPWKLPHRQCLICTHIWQAKADKKQALKKKSALV